MFCIQMETDGSARSGWPLTHRCRPAYLYDAVSGPPGLYWIFRQILISRHSIDCAKGAEIGDGLYLPHPINIVFGMGATVGSGVTIYHGVTLGQISGKYPKIEDDVVIYPNSTILGSVVIPKGGKVAACSCITSRKIDRRE